MGIDQLGDFFVRDHARALGIDRHVHRLGHTNGIGHLDLALACQPGSDNVFGHIACRIGRRTVYLAGVLAREGATTMGAGTAVGVDNDLAAGQAAIALRSANHEAPGGVDQVAGVLQPLFGQYGLDDFFDHGLVELGFHLVAQAHLGAVLAGQDHGVNAVRLAVHVAHGDLALGVRAQEWQTAVLAQLGLAFDQAVGVVDGRGHQLGCLVAGVAEHQALVTGTGIQMVVAGVVHALGDVIALLVVSDQHGAALVVNAVFGVVVANALDGVARHLDVVHVGIGGDFTCQDYQTSVAQRLGRYARFGVLLEDRVQDCIRNLVGDFVGMTFGHRFRGKKKIVRHANCSKKTSSRVAWAFGLRRTL